ncbi:hypothetical protein BH11MYX2_BH11MYX2_31300 [soil metagenome]
MPVNVGMVVPSSIAATDMIATLPTRVADVVVDSVGLVRLPPPIDLPRFKISAAWHERYHHDVPHRWLRAGLRRRLRDPLMTP